MQTQKIISWNVASVRARLPALLQLLEQGNPDVVLLQEIKAEESTFPFFDLKIAGYNAVIAGQKSYNGVAILSKEKLTNVQSILLPNEENPQARFIQAETESGITVISVYVPNGNPPEKDPTDKTKLMYKLKWMKALNEHVKKLLDEQKAFVLGGDFNVIERDSDVYNPEVYRQNALMLPEVRSLYNDLLSLDVVNAIRLKNPEPHTYSFWDFQMNAFAKDWGMLLDALFVAKKDEAKIVNAGIYKNVRGWDKTSDHAPIFIELSKDI